VTPFGAFARFGKGLRLAGLGMFAGAAAVLAAITVLASLIPGLRASASIRS